jgi:uncharacterized protein
LNSVAAVLASSANLRRSLGAALCLACALLVYCAASRAEVVDGLYEAAVPVAGKESSARNNALAAALLQVAVKVSGARDARANPVIVDASRRAARHMQQYGFRTTPSGGLLLQAQFDQRAIDALLGEAGLPVWSRTRPSVLVWTAVETEEGRTLLGADDSTGLSKVLLRAAYERGLPLMLPLLDLEDRGSLNVSDIWGGFGERLVRASQRYQSETVLAVRAYRVLPSLWEGQWRLFIDGSNDDWTTRGATVATVLEEGVHEAAGRLAQRFARSAAFADASGVRLSVRGIRALADYSRTLDYLRSLDLVSRVRVTRVDQDFVSFAVEARGGYAALQQVIALGNTLTEIGGPEAPQFELLP